jgi:hypothetical protein
MPKMKRINKEERRSAPRVIASEVIPRAVTRLTSGQEVGLVNIGLNGTVLVTSKIMLSPGSYIRLRLKIQRDIIILNGRIIRCRVVKLKQAKIQFEAAIILDGGLPQPLAEILRLHGETAPGAEQSSLQDINSDLMTLPETAELSLLNGPGTKAW